MSRFNTKEWINSIKTHPPRHELKVSVFKCFSVLLIMDFLVEVKRVEVMSFLNTMKYKVFDVKE